MPFSLHKRYLISRSTPLHCSTVQWNWQQYHVNPAKNLPPDGPKYPVLLMARNSLLPVQDAGMEGMSLRGVTSDWNCMLYRKPPVTKGQDTHTHMFSPFVDVIFIGPILLNIGMNLFFISGLLFLGHSRAMWPFQPHLWQFTLAFHELSPSV